MRLTDGTTIAGTISQQDRFTREVQAPHQPPVLIAKHAIAALTPAATNGGTR
ncbi:MAG: RNA chaperone Hfq [Sphaerobacter sp.]|nr:RNA chaperone Hfq [Sphaerobacter sp.]